MHRKLSVAILAAAAGAALFAMPSAHAGGVSWGVSITVPGFAVVAGPPAFGWRAPPAARYIVPAVAPPPVFAPRVVVPPRVVVAPPVVYRPAWPRIAPAPVLRPRPIVVVRRW